ncbi:MAG: hypothetical protein KDK35_01625 [Leptospiraceae bacterium]|nr:hypothetical protein [Leptospiraceae bacterium]
MRSMVLAPGVLILFAYAPLLAGDEQIEVGFWREVGQRYQLSIENYRQSRSNVRLVPMRTPVEVEVLDFSPELVRISWTFGEAVPVDESVEMSSVMRLQSGINNGLRFVFRMDGNTGQISVENAEEYRAHLEKQRRLILDALSANEEQRARMEALLTQIARPDAIASEMLGTFQLLYFFAGFELSTAAPADLQVALATITEETIPGTARATLSELRDDGTAIVLYEAEADREAAREFILRFMERLGVSMPEGQEMPEVQITETGTYHIAYEDGFVLRMEFERFTRIHDREFRNRVIISTTPPAP